MQGIITTHHSEQWQNRGHCKIDEKDNHIILGKPLSVMCQALLQYTYRNTPSHKNGQSPAQKLFGRPMQDTLPSHRHSFAPEWQCSTFEAEQLAEHILTHTTIGMYAHNLQDIQVGSTIALQNPRTKLWAIYNTVVNVSPPQAVLSEDPQWKCLSTQ